MGYSFRFTARVLLYASSHRQDNTYHGLCYTSRGALAGTRNSSMGSPWRIDPTTHRSMSERSYHGATSRSRADKCEEKLQELKWYELIFGQRMLFSFFRTPIFNLLSVFLERFQQDTKWGRCYLKQISSFLDVGNFDAAIIFAFCINTSLYQHTLPSTVFKPMTRMNAYSKWNEPNTKNNCVHIILRPSPLY